MRIFGSPRLRVKVEWIVCFEKIEYFCKKNQWILIVLSEKNPKLLI